MRPQVFAQLSTICTAARASSTRSVQRRRAPSFSSAKRRLAAIAAPTANGRLQFYGFVDVAQKCGLLYAFRPRCEVSWRPDAIDNYCALFAKCIVDPALVIPFTYERNSHIVARCIACEESHEPRASHVFVFSLTEWSALRSHMQHIVGIVEKVGAALNSKISVFSSS